MLGQLRSKIGKLIDRYVGKPIAATGVSPNAMCALSLPLAAIAAFFIYAQNWPWALGFMLASIVIDNIDGAVARAQKTVSKWGSYWDVMVDKHVEMIIYLGFVPAHPVLAFLAATLTMLNSYAKPSAALRIPLGNADWPAIGERADRLIVLLAGVLTAIYYPVLFGISTIQITLCLVTTVCVIGDVQRMRFAKKLIRNYERTKKKQMVRK